MRAASDVVITAGGIGPTVDDVTIAGVAQAHDCRVIRHPDLEAGLRDYFGDQVCIARGPATLLCTFTEHTCPAAPRFSALAAGCLVGRLVVNS